LQSQRSGDKIDENDGIFGCSLSTNIDERYFCLIILSDGV